MTNPASVVEESSDAAPVVGAAASEGSDDSKADLGAIATGLVSTMPQVQQHAVDAARAETAAAADGPKDDTGALFNDAIHQRHADGSPRKTARGTWAVKRGKAGQSNNVAGARTPGASTLNAPQPPDQKKLAAQEASRQAGKGMAEMFMMTGRAVFGEEWAPRVDKNTGHDERAMLHEAFGDYAVATNKADIPPGLALSFAMLLYMAPRFMMPQTQARVRGIKARIAQWWLNRKLRKAGLRAQVVNASPDNADQGRRNKGE